MDTIHPDLLAYFEALCPSSGRVLEEMEAYAQAEAFPIVGPQVGRLLCQLATLHRPKRIFEMGSGFGYAAAWLLRGAPEARMVCTEWDEENIARGREWLGREGCADRTTWYQGDALEILREDTETYDLVVNDVDKEAYPAVLPVALDHLRPGGLLITDNIMWHGRVTQVTDDPETVAIQAYTRMLFDEPDLFTTLIPLRDGVAVTLKQGG